jgi:hypothetical protein
LEGLFDFCDFVARCQWLLQLLHCEVICLDEVFGVCEDAKFPVDSEAMNQVHFAVDSLKEDIDAALEMGNVKIEWYTFQLTQRVRSRERKLKKYHEKLTDSFPTRDRSDADNRLRTATAMKAKLINLEPGIEEALHFQKILNVKLGTFSDYRKIRKEADFFVRLYDCAAQWARLECDVEEVTLSLMNMPKFVSDIGRIRTSVLDLAATTGTENESLTGSMQVHHWTALFAQCKAGKPYYGQVKIEELIVLGILNNKDIISTITETSLDESKLEMEFQGIHAHWRTICLPFLNPSRTSDSVLGNMMKLPYAQAIRGDMGELGRQLEDSAEVIQARWPLLAPVFRQDDSKRALPEAYEIYEEVQTRWKKVEEYCQTTKRLLDVCPYPGMPELFMRNNNDLVDM